MKFSLKLITNVLMFFVAFSFSLAAQSGTVQDTIKTLIDTQIICLNNEDVSGYMKTIHPQAEGYHMMKQVLQMTFKNFDFTTTADSITIVSVADNLAVADITLSVTTSESSSTRTIKQEFKRYKGKWLFYGTSLQ